MLKVKVKIKVKLKEKLKVKVKVKVKVKIRITVKVKVKVNLEYPFISGVLPSPIYPESSSRQAIFLYVFFLINTYTVTVNSFANPVLYYTRTFRLHYIC